MARVVIFGDSNEAWFGPAVRSWCTQHGIAQPGDIALKSVGGTFLQWRPGQAQWPWLAEQLEAHTSLVVIGLGGNFIPKSDVHVAAISALVAAIAQQAPAARLVWRGPPPATARTTANHARLIASPRDKMLRYRKNAVLRAQLNALQFVTFGAAKPAVGHATRVYIDAVSLHAGGPSPLPGGGIALQLGTPACLAYERQALAAGGPALANEAPSAGPWTSFLASEDTMSAHVHTQPALDLIHNHCGPRGVYG